MVTDTGPFLGGKQVADDAVPKCATASSGSAAS